MFSKYTLDYNNIYAQLACSKFENITEARKGAILVDYKDNKIPIVRTTTIYNDPVQLFQPIHYDIIQKIKDIAMKNDLEFNNAMVEIYEPKYYKMGFHSDQALDLANDSYICLFSCYEHNNLTNIRTLEIKEKGTNINYMIDLTHNSIVLFSLETNSRYLHKIILNKATTNNKWLGITFRLSKTFIYFINEIPYFYNTIARLQIATDNQKKDFYKCRSEENKSIQYVYSDIYYTISPSDLLLL